MRDVLAACEFKKVEDPGKSNRFYAKLVAISIKKEICRCQSYACFI